MRVRFLLSSLFVATPVLILGAVYLLSESALRQVTQEARFNHLIPTDAQSIERGRHIARSRGCFGCHGQQLQGKNFDQQWDWPDRAVAPNLATYAKANEPATIEAAIRQGIDRDGKALTSMPSYNYVHLTDEDTAALIAFLRAAPVVEIDLPKPRLGWAVRWDFARGAETHMADWADVVPPLQVSARQSPQLAHGEYLAMTMCNECHGFDLRGSTLFGPPTPDLAVTVSYDREAFETLLTTGIARDGRKLGLMSLVAPDRYPELTPSELDDLHAFLISLPGRQKPAPVSWRSASP